MKVNDFASIFQKPETKEAWSEYVSMERKNIKIKAKLNLEVFIQVLKSENSRIVDEFAEKICQGCMDILENQSTSYWDIYFSIEDTKFKIRHPLFQEIILPYIARKFLIQKYPYGICLAAFEQYFYSDPKLLGLIKEKHYFNSEYYFDAAYFLRLSLTENPNDKLGRKLLMYTMGRRLSLVFHEVPHGVLDNDTMAVEQELCELEALAKDSEHYDNWIDAIQYWRSCNQAWSEYLNLQENYTNFEDFIRKETSIPLD